ncbi:transcriptional regulator [bacterium]|nr:MAG: transcriptional regulator [bacterium]
MSDVLITLPPHDRVLALFEEFGVVRPRDLEARGLSRSILRRLLNEGLVTRVGRGLYTLAAEEADEHRALLEAARRVPHGIVCLVSALRLHGLTTQQPYQVWLALSHSARQPKVDHPPLRVVRMSGAAWTNGREESRVGGVAVPVFGIAKTVADCFKFRSKVGLDVALEALREVLADRRATIDELWDMARVCRVTRVMHPYLESLA